jgi:hypothetical protein
MQYMGTARFIFFKTLIFVITSRYYLTQLDTAYYNPIIIYHGNLTTKLTDPKALLVGMHCCADPT